MAVNPIAMALMPISNVASWYLLLQAVEDSAAFYQRVAQIAAFYCAWALYKKIVEGNKKELGHISMGLLAISAGLYSQQRPLVLAFTALVVLNFAAVIPFFVNRGVTGIVKMIHKEVTSLSMTWGYVFLVYLLSNVVLWGFVFKTILAFE